MLKCSLVGKFEFFWNEYSNLKSSFYPVEGVPRGGDIQVQVGEIVLSDKLPALGYV